jgi:hypothetical protein
MVKMRTRFIVLLMASAIGTAAGWSESQAGQEERNRPKTSLKLRVSPSIAFSPARISAHAELQGADHPEDQARLYCASIEWDWGDGTKSESEYDCEPYEEGKSTLKRRFSAQHTYNFAGRYRVQLRLKRENKTLIATNSNIQVRAGAREWGTMQ